MVKWTYILKNCEVLPENVSTDMQSIFTSEIFHILHLGISGRIKEFITTYLSSEYILSHPFIPCVNRKAVSLIHDSYISCVQFSTGGIEHHLPAAGLNLDLSNHDPSSHLIGSFMTDGVRVRFMLDRKELFLCVIFILVSAFIYSCTSLQELSSMNPVHTLYY